MEEAVEFRGTLENCGLRGWSGQNCNEVEACSPTLTCTVTSMEHQESHLEMNRSSTLQQDVQGT